MAAIDYAELQAAADEAIAEAGMAAVLRRYPSASGTAYNPTMGPPVETACVVVVTAFKLAEIDGSRVLATDKKALIAAGTTEVTPDPALRLVLNDVEHTIVDVQTIQPAATALLYKAQVRR